MPLRSVASPPPPPLPPQRNATPRHATHRILHATTQTRPPRRRTEARLSDGSPRRPRRCSRRRAPPPRVATTSTNTTTTTTTRPRRRSERAAMRGTPMTKIARLSSVLASRRRGSRGWQTARVRIECSGRPWTYSAGVTTMLSAAGSSRRAWRTRTAARARICCAWVGCTRKATEWRGGFGIFTMAAPPPPLPPPPPPPPPSPHTPHHRDMLQAIMWYKFATMAGSSEALSIMAKLCVGGETHVEGDENLDNSGNASYYSFGDPMCFRLARL